MKGSDYDIREELRALNEQQLKAVLAPIDRPILVVAGAGSGKTRVLTLRVAYLVKEIGIPEDRILAVTFTNKAADEMKERLSRYIDVKKLSVGTFHSFALRIVRENLGNLTVYDEDDTKAILEPICKDLGYSVKEIKNAISRYKNTGKIPENLDEGVFSSILEVYQDKLKKANALDFDDILIRANEVLEDENIRKKYSQKLYYILVDEYQDTNPLQHKILVKIAGNPEHRRVFVVGDEDQAIYSFRGADYTIFLNFQRDFPNTLILKLERNYRSTQKILDLANNLIRYNHNRREKFLFTDRKTGPEPIYKCFNTPEEEADWVAKEILSKGFKPEDVMVLYRANYISRVFEQAMVRYGIPYKIIGDVGFFQRKEIKDILSFLRVALNPKDFVSLRRSMLLVEGLGENTVNRVIMEIEAGKSWEDIKNISRFRLGKISEYFSLLKDLKNEPPREAVQKVIDFLNYYEYLRRFDPEKYEDRIENVEELLNMAYTYQSEGKGLEEFLYAVSLLSSADTKEGNAVSLMTVHSAKGLERDVVFVVGLEDGTFPHYKSLEEGNEDEERRLCYVAITRAKTYLYLTHAKIRGYNRHSLKPSRFLEEMGIMGYTGNDDIKKGDSVYHEKYGYGKVLSIDGNIVKVMFKDFVKSFDKDKAKLKKI